MTVKSVWCEILKSVTLLIRNVNRKYIRKNISLAKNTYFGVLCDGVYKSQCGLREESARAVRRQRRSSFDERIMGQVIRLPQTNSTHAKWVIRKNYRRKLHISSMWGRRARLSERYRAKSAAEGQAWVQDVFPFSRLTGYEVPAVDQEDSRRPPVNTHSTRGFFSPLEYVGMFRLRKRVCLYENGRNGSFNYLPRLYIRI